MALRRAQTAQRSDDMARPDGAAGPRTSANWKDERMHENWSDYMNLLRPALKELRGGVPEVMKAFSAVAQAALTPKALDTKTKELIAIAISVAIRCDDCIAFHVQAAIDRGATREEVFEALAMAIYMGAGPSVMYASHVAAAFSELEKKKS